MIFLYCVYSTLQFNFKRTFAAPTFIKRNVCPLLYDHQNRFLQVFHNLRSKQLINNKTFEHDSLIFTEPQALANEIVLNIMQNFKFNFLKNEFWADCGVRFKFHFQNLKHVQRDIRAKKRYQGHSPSNGAKSLMLGHDPSQNLIKFCQVVTICKI